ncbi:MAG: hypothetical protein AAGF59_07520 [Pseudomonadota bacterium]
MDGRSGVARSGRLTGNVAAALASILTASLVLTGCFSKTGDFGRPEAGPLRRTVLPAVGKSSAMIRAEPVSFYNLTDNEKLLRNRATYLRFPPHTRDWFGRAVTELETTRVVGGFGLAHAPTRYYGFLRSDRFRSSESRYERLKADILTDADLVQPFYAAARKVRFYDRERLLATRRRPDLTEAERLNATGRVHENTQIMNQVSAALRYRLAAYRFAIDRMEIETPSDQIYDANRAWRRLSAEIVSGEAALEQRRGPGEGHGTVRRSRIYTGPFEDDGPVVQK